MADSQLAVGREVPRHTFANSVKYMIREGSLLRECNDGSKYRCCRANASFPPAASTSARWASMALSLPLALKTTLPVLSS